MADRRIRHIGIFRSLCGAVNDADLRTDLGSREYRTLGVKHRFKGEKKYRVCRRCIAVVEGKNRWFHG